MGKRDAELFSAKWDPLGWVKDALELIGETVGGTLTEYVNAPVKAAGIQSDATKEVSRLSTEAGNNAVGAYTAGQDKAINAYTTAQNNTLNVLRGEIDRQRADLAPYQTAGTNALAELQNTRYIPFGQDQFQVDPGYRFRLAEGLKGLEHSASARGGMLTGGTLKAITNYGQGAASQEYGNAFNRYQTEFANKLNPLQYLANLGYGATGQGINASQGYAANVGNAYTGTAANVGNLGMQGANALAEGYMGGQNARASAFMGGANLLSALIGTGLNYAQSQDLVNMLRQPNGGQRPVNTNPVRSDNVLSGMG